MSEGFETGGFWAGGLFIWGAFGRGNFGWGASGGELTSTDPPTPNTLNFKAICRIILCAHYYLQTTFLFKILKYFFPSSLVCPLPSHLVPRIGKGHRKNKESVFVFTPLNFGGNEQKHKVNFQWVANDVSEVCLTLYNPLPIEVRLIGLALLHEGIEFENCPSTLSLAPNSGPHHVSLLGKIHIHAHNIL